MNRVNWAEYKAKTEACQKVWATWHKYEGVEEISDLYESKEAAQLEIAWCKRKGKKPPTISPFHVNTLELAKERWDEDDLMPLSGGGVR